MKLFSEIAIIQHYRGDSSQCNNTRDTDSGYKYWKRTDRNRYLHMLLLSAGKIQKN